MLGHAERLGYLGSGVPFTGSGAPSARSGAPFTGPGFTSAPSGPPSAPSGPPSGPLGRLDSQVAHSAAFADLVLDLLPTCLHRRLGIVDLGTGGGVPGLVVACRLAATLAAARPQAATGREDLAATSPPAAEGAHLWLVEASESKAAFLADAVSQLGLSGHVSVIRARAEALGRDAAFRGAVDVVTARAFGKPAVTAECAAPLLAPGGVLVVSEPPPDGGSLASRWPPAGLSELGLGEPRFRQVGSYGFVLLPRQRQCPARFPRRVGVPAKRPLF